METNRVDSLIEDVTMSPKVRKGFKYLSFVMIFVFIIIIVAIVAFYKYVIVTPVVSDERSSYKAINSEILTSKETHRYLERSNIRIVKYIGDTENNKYSAGACFYNLFLSDNVGFTYKDGKNILFTTKSLLNDSYICKLSNKRNANALEFDINNISKEYLTQSDKYIALSLWGTDGKWKEKEITNFESNIQLNDGTTLIPLAIINTKDKITSKKDSIEYIKKYGYEYTPQMEYITANMIEFTNYFFHNITNADTKKMVHLGKDTDKFAKELCSLAFVGNTSRARLDSSKYTLGINSNHTKYPNNIDMTNKVW